MIEIKNLNKYFFRHKRNELHVINDTSLSLPNKGLITILGESGSGKTTLLNVIGGLDGYDSGELIIEGKKITKGNVDNIRNLLVGYIFQDYKLLDDLTVYENTAISLKLCGLNDEKEIKKRVDYVLNVLGLYRFRNRKASNLSGGERQRVGIARAIVKNPKIVICDEPTGNLDSRNSVEIMNIIKSISRERLVILVTHETNLAEFYSDRIIKILDGKIVSDELNESKDELDYELDNKIYLKDIANREEYNLGDNEINIFYDEESKTKINIVIKKGNVFIETNSKNTELINDRKIELVDDHKKKIDKSVYEQYEFKLDDFNKSNKPIYSFGRMLIDGCKKLKGIKIIKKLLIFTCFISAILIFIAFAKLGKLSHFEVRDYVKYSNDLILISADKPDDKRRLVDYMEHSDDNYFYTDLAIEESIVFNLDYFFQTISLGKSVISVSIAPIEGIEETDLIIGRMPENNTEVVIDKMIFDMMQGFRGAANKSDFLKSGITEVKDVLGLPFTIDHDETKYTIVGVVDKEAPVVYHRFVDSTKDYSDYSSYLNYLNYIDEYTITEGYEPTNTYEVIVNEIDRDKYKIGDSIDYINNHELTVVGYYESSMILSPLTNKETMFMESLGNYIGLDYYVFTKNKEEAIENAKKHGFMAVDMQERARESFMMNMYYEIEEMVQAAVIFLIISIIELYLVLRTSLIARVKEIGIYRSIGVKKGDIYRMFLSESMILVSIGGILGLAGIYSLFRELIRYPEISYQYYISPLTAILSFLVLVFITSLITIIPIYFIVRKYPAQILSRKDI